MIGRRVPVRGDTQVQMLRPGDYALVHGTWHACTPNGHLANLANHEVTEHEDGTITVRPSIKVSGGHPVAELWHGWLERGNWREA